ncbi:MAG: hypothetical protein BWY59_00566 [Verrucomicrobia bacterium ADurb.Bin345]|nr:MAG: hypothetical protein BWY59_00566 [Verrucomicrobia bacterium ADurb.Bin345]
MSPPVCLEIAGVHFTIRCRQTRVLPDPWECYRSFRTDGGPTADMISVNLSIEIGGVPDLSSARRVFESESWSLFAGDGAVYIALAPRPGGLPPAWVARMSPDFTEGTVFCDEMLVRDNDGVSGIINPILHRLDQLLVMYLLAQREGVIIHSAGAALNGKGMVFAGRSGAGKSTLSRLLRDHADPARTVLLSDDRSVVRRIGSEFLVFGTPWAGDAQIGLSARAPLTGLYFLQHANEDRIEPLAPAAAAQALLPVASIPWYDRHLVEATTSFCERIVNQVPAFNLHFRPGREVLSLLQ